MRRAICACLLWTICSVPSYGSYGVLPLEKWVTNSEIIVVGKISRVEARHFSLTYFKSGSKGREKNFVTYYDVGTIVNPTVLRGSPALAHIQIAFTAPNQKGPFSHMHLSYTKGQHGIWFLKRDSLTGLYIASFKDLKLRPEVERLVEAEAKQRKAANQSPPGNAGQ